MGVYRYLYNKEIMESEVDEDCYIINNSEGNGFTVGYSSNMKVLVMSGFIVSVILSVVSVFGNLVGYFGGLGFNIRGSIEFGVLALVLRYISGVVNVSQVCFEEDRVIYTSPFSKEEVCLVSDANKVDVVMGCFLVFYSGSGRLLSVIFNFKARAEVVQWCKERGIRLEEKGLVDMLELLVGFVKSMRKG